LTENNNIKSKAISGLLWNLIENGGNYLINFLLGLVLIRIIDTQYFGIVGMMSFYILLGNVLASFSLSNYLIQKPIIKNEDFSSSLWLNLFFSVFFYSIIYFASDSIAEFYNEASISYYLKIFGLNVIFSGLSVVQISDLSRKMNFKLLAKINLFALLISGIIAISLAYYGFALLSLIIFQLANTFIIFLLLWIFNKWDYGFRMSWLAIRNISKFSMSIFLVNSINTLYNEIYNVIIGKLFKANQLAYYLRGKHTAEVLPQQFSTGLLKVLLPVMSNLQFDKLGLGKTYHKVLMLTGLINIPILTFLAANGETIFVLLYTEKWLSAVIFYQLFCIEGMLLPLHLIGSNMLIAKGKTKEFMYLELSKRLLQSIVIYFTLSSPEMMVIGLIILSLIYTLVAFYIVKVESDYKIYEQIKYILPYLAIALLLYLINTSVNYLLTDINLFLLLLTNFSISLIVYLSILIIFKMESFDYIKEIISTKIKRKI